MKKFDFKKIGTKVLGSIGGAVAANIVENKVLPAGWSQTAKGVALIALAAVAPSFLSKGKNEVIEAVADGMSAQGGLSIAKGLMPNLISGIEDGVSGYDPMVAGPGIKDIKYDEAIVKGPSDKDEELIKGNDPITG